MAFVKTGPHVQFSKLCWQKMWSLVHSCDIEVSWFMYAATAEEIEELGIETDFYFKDVYVVDQVCSGVKSDMVGTAVGDLCGRLMDEGLDPAMCYGFGHSHVKMSVDPSGTDEATFDRLESDPLISIILNKKGDVYLRCDVWEPWRHSYICTYNIDDIQLIEDDWGKKMVKEHVTREVIKPSFKYGTYLNGKKPAAKTTMSTTSSNWSRDSGWTRWEDDYILDFEGDKNPNEGGKNPKKGTKPDDVILEELCLGTDFDLLEDCFREGIIDINELLDYHASVRSGEFTKDEMEDQLQNLYGTAGSDVGGDVEEIEDAEFVIGETVVDAKETISVGSK